MALAHIETPRCPSFARLTGSGNANTNFATDRLRTSELQTIRGIPNLTLARHTCEILITRPSLTRLLLRTIIPPHT